MLNPIILALRCQQICTITAWRLSQQTLAAFLNMAEGATTGYHPKQKKPLKRRHAQPVTRGPDLKDRYGRRAHDVEIEKI